MQRTFLSSLAFLVLINLLVKPAWILGIDLSVQNRVGFDAYGIYFALFNFSYLFHIVLDAGITNYNNKTIAAQPGLLGKYLSNILLIKAGLALVYIGITFVAAFLLAYDERQIELLSYLALNQVMASALLYLRSNISGLHLFRTDALVSITDKLLMIGICSYLLWGIDGFVIDWFIYAQTAAYGISLVIAGVIVLTRTKSLQFGLDLKLAGEILRKSYPFAFLVLMMAIYYRVDGVMIERLLPAGGSEQAGIYASAYRLLDVFNMCGILFASLLLPMFSRMFERKQAVGELLGLSFRNIMAISILVSVAVWFYSEPIMRALYPEADSTSFHVFQYLTLSFIPISSVYIYGTLMTASGNLRHLNMIAAFGLIGNIGLNWMLIPEYEALGATYATLLTQVVVGAAHLLTAQHLFKLRIVLALPFQLLGFTLLTYGTAHFLLQATSSWATNLILTILIGIGYAFVLRLVEWRNTMSLFRSAD
jgi:O-antigen/teichoic acid export membrane protein